MSRRPAIHCSAKARRTGEQCKRWAMYGSDVCMVHGGKAPQVRAAAERRLTQAATEKAAARYATPRDDVTPSVALVEELRRAAGYVTWIEQRLRDGDGTPLTSVEWQMLGAERDRLSRLAGDMAKLGLEQSLIEVQIGRIEEEHIKHSAELLRVLIGQALMTLGWVPPSDPHTARRLSLHVRVWAIERLGQSMPAGHPWHRPESEMPAELAESLQRQRAEAERPFRERITELEAEVERLRERVQADGIATRLALPAGGPAPEVFDVEDPVVVDPEPLPDGEPIEPDEVLPPAASRPRRGQSVLEHFAGARRSAGYRP